MDRSPAWRPTSARRPRPAGATALVAVALLALAGCGGSSAKPSASATTAAPGATTTSGPAVAGPVLPTTATTAAPVDGTIRRYSGLSRNHVTGRVSYPQTPPVGGDHNAVWQTCAFYAEPVPDETAVHSMEHGAVWVTYRPTLTGADRTALQALTKLGDHVLVSPHDGLRAPVVASAWGVQQDMTGPADPNLQAFIASFQNGPQTPEPGSPCQGGYGGTAAQATGG